MIPFGNKTVTLLHKGVSGYTRHILTGCSWRVKAVNSISDNMILQTFQTTCRIPVGRQKPSAGDVLFLGERDAEASSEIDIKRLIDAARDDGVPAFRVTGVQDNSLNGILAHYAATGE